MFNKIDIILYVSICLLIGIITLRILNPIKNKENMTTQYYSVLSDNKLVNIEDITLDNNKKVFNIDINNARNKEKINTDVDADIDNSCYTNQIFTGEGSAPNIWSGDSLVRASTTGLFAETGPFGHNVGSYEARLGGCNCPIKPGKDVSGEENNKRFHSSHFTTEGFRARCLKPDIYESSTDDKGLPPPDNIVYTNQEELIKNIKDEVKQASELAAEKQIEESKRNAQRRYDAITNYLQSSITTKLNNLRDTGYAEVLPATRGSFDGNDGIDGTDGTDGTSGTGFDGNDGNDGNDGTSGTGFDGRTGSDGSDGLTGPAGPAGADGVCPACDDNLIFRKGPNPGDKSGKDVCENIDWAPGGPKGVCVELVHYYNNTIYKDCSKAPGRNTGPWTVKCKEDPSAKEVDVAATWT